MEQEAFIASRLPGKETVFYRGKISYSENYIFAPRELVFVVKPFQLYTGLYIINDLQPIASAGFECYYSTNISTQDSQEDYNTVFQKTYTEILLDSGLKKVVLSRTKTRDKPADLIKYYNSLCKKFPNCFVNLFSSKATGTWIGASPEVLFKMGADSLETMALAGTKNKNTENWSNKEQAEQKFVVDYIKEFFENLGLNYDIKNEHLQMGNIEHLLTKFESKNNSDIWKFINNFINKFAPSPAVCGYPKELAFNTIIQNELYNRELYTGFWGFINYEKEVDIYVNLRCAQITEKEIIYYAGGGINKGSEAQKEWQETEAKIKLLEF
ncbi:MAG: chorismate-binding protein [Bacteroidota bacterium]|nr:chorismate-binding protein [Bacteroidota bacterium]